MRRELALLVTAACGRYHFDPLADSDGGVDANACGHTFCDNFDRTTPIEAAWDSATKTPAASYSYTAAAVSPPQAFEVDLPITSTDNAYLEKQLPLATTSAIVDLQLDHASASPAGAEMDLVQLSWNTLPAGCTSFGYYLVRDATNNFNLQETYGGCGGNAQNLSQDLTNTGMHHVRMEITFGNPGHLRVFVDDMATPLIDHDIVGHSVDPSTLLLRVGGGASRQTNAPWTFRYDDILVDVQ